MSNNTQMAPDDTSESSSVHNGNVAEALRNQKGKIFKAVADIEEKSQELAEEFSLKLEEVTQEKIELVFLELSIYSGRPLITDEPNPNLVYVIAGDDDQPICSFRIQHDAARRLLAITFGGPKAEITDLGEGSLRTSEQMLFAVLIDRLMAGFFERVDLQPALGVPRKPVIIPDEELEELAQSAELISFTYRFMFSGKDHDFQLIVPLSVFENGSADRDSRKEIEEAKTRERTWSDRIYERVKQVEVPHAIEIGKFQVSLAHVAALQTGQQLDIKFDMREVKVLDPSGVASFSGEIKTYANGMTLEVARSAQEERV